MKRILLFLFIITSGVVYGQGGDRASAPSKLSIGKGRTDLHRWFDNAGKYTPLPIPPGYTKINARYNWIAGYFDTALHLPGYNGVPTGNRTGSWVGDGAIAMDTTTGTIYGRFNGTWVAAGGATPGLQDVITQDPDMVDDATIGIPSAKLFKIQKNTTSGNSQVPAFVAEYNLSGASNPPIADVGRFDFIIPSGGGSLTGTSVSGVVTRLTTSAATNLSVYSGLHVDPVISVEGSTIGFHEGLSIDGWGNHSTINYLYGVFLGQVSNGTGGSVNNHYGIYIDDVSLGVTENFALYTVSGGIRLGALPTGASTDSIMTWEAATGVVRKRNVASITGVNIYNSDGTLTGDRTVTGAGFNLILNNANSVSFRSTGSAGLRTTAGSQSNDITTLPTAAQITADGLNKLSSVVANQDSVLIQYTNDNRDSLSEIVVKATEIKLRPGYGKLFIDTLTLVPGTKALRYNPATGLVSYADTSTAAGGGATVALDNLSAVAINVALLPGTSDAIALGSTTKQWSDLFLAEGGVINWDAGDATLTQAGNVVTLDGAAFTVNDKIRSLSVGGVGTGIEVEASGSANYASIDYLNDLGTRFQTGLYGSTAGNPGAAFFFQAAAVPIVMFTNSLNRLDIAGSGVITLSNLAGTGSRTVLADAAGVLSAPVSDISVKEHIKPIGSAVGVIMRLKPVSFEYKQGWENYGEGVQMGFIAQDVAEVLPNSAFMNTSEGKLKGMMGYNETDLIPILVAAVQEQQKQINALKREIQKLKKK